MTVPKQTIISAEKESKIKDKCVILPTDSETMIEIKKFMLEHGITDILKRMLKIQELLQIQGFPKEYVLKGTETKQKEFIGNAVEVKVGRAFISNTIQNIVG